MSRDGNGNGNWNGNAYGNGNVNDTAAADGSPGERPTRIVADADVLAADLLVGGASRDALDAIRGHSWLTLVASEPLLEDAQAVISDLADPSLADDWREAVEGVATLVEHPEGDHPALACAYRGEAGHLLTFDEDLQSAQMGSTLRRLMDTSVRHPRAFVTVFDPEALYEASVGGTSPGSDRHQRR